MKHFSELHTAAAKQPAHFPFSRAAPHEPPLIELLVPLFDAARPLAETLADLAEQSWTRWAVTVRDDGSRDGGPDFVRAFGATIADRPVRLKGGTHRGLARGAITLLAEADPLADLVVVAEPGARFGQDAFARFAPRLRAAGAHPTLWIVHGGRQECPPAELSFEETLRGERQRPAMLAANRPAVDLLRIAAAWRGPVPCHVEWAARLVTGSGGTATRETMVGASPAGRRRRRRREPGGRGLDPIRAAGPLLTAGARQALDAASREEDARAAGGTAAGRALRRLLPAALWRRGAAEHLPEA